MNISSQVEPVVSAGAAVVVLAGVAALARTVSQALFGPAHHSIARDDLKRISEKYGWWAARRAEAFCPEDDVACVEREAKRLFTVVTQRR